MSHDIAPEQPLQPEMTPPPAVLSNRLSREQREEMKTLSREIFGVSSKWKTLLDHGYLYKVTRKVVEHVPQEDGTIKEVEKEVPALNEHGQEYSVRKYYTYDELKAKMLDLKERMRALNETLKKQQEEAKAAKEAADKGVITATGTAL